MINYKKGLYLVLIIDFLLLALLGALSFRFLSEQLRKSQTVDPEILAQYEINLEVNQFFTLVKQLKKTNNP